MLGIVCPLFSAVMISAKTDLMTPTFIFSLLLELCYFLPVNDTSLTLLIDLSKTSLMLHRLLYSSLKRDTLSPVFVNSSSFSSKTQSWPKMKQKTVIIVGGVSGCGKSTLTDSIVNCKLNINERCKSGSSSVGYDGDHFHSLEAKEKMARGIGFNT